MMANYHAFWSTGLVNFGHFVIAGQAQPFTLNLGYLPSYPDLMRLLAAELDQNLLEHAFDRILCTSEAVSLGTALSLETHVPLIYGKEKILSPVHDLVGAYDVGHPAILLTYVLDDPAGLTRLIGIARKGGLEIDCIVSLLDLETYEKPDNITFISLMTLSGYVHLLIEDGLLPAYHMNAIENWIRNRRVSSAGD